jgi:hypothetical protein
MSDFGGLRRSPVFPAAAPDIMGQLELKYQYMGYMAPRRYYNQ